MDPDAYALASTQNYWTGASAVAAWMIGVATIMVNAVGLYFVWRQLRASREALASAALSAEAAAEAAKISYLASRPWIRLTVERAWIDLSDARAAHVGCQVNVRYENIGQTPAVQVGLVFRPVPITRENNLTWTEVFPELFSAELEQPRTLFPGESFSPGPSRNFPFPPLPSESGLSFRLAVAALYKSHATGKRYWTPLAFQLQQVDPPNNVHQWYRGMGRVECLVINLGTDTPDPT